MKIQVRYRKNLKMSPGKECASDFSVGLDAARYRRLARLVEFGCWSVGRHEIKDSHGLTDDTFMDDKTDMDAWLDKPEVITDSESCVSTFRATPNC